MKKGNIYTRLLISLCATSVGIYIQSTWNIPLYFLVMGIVVSISLAIGSLYHKNIFVLLCSTALLSGCIGSTLITLQRYEHELYLKILSGKKLAIISTVTDKDEWVGEKNGEVLHLSINEIDDENSSLHQ